MSIDNPEIAVEGASAVKWLVLAAMSPLLQCAFLPDNKAAATVAIISMLACGMKASFAMCAISESSENTTEGDCS